MKNNVKISRIKVSMKQDELATVTGVTRQTIGLIEKGDYNPSLNLSIAIAKALDKTLDELFWEVD